MSVLMVEIIKPESLLALSMLFGEWVVTCALEEARVRNQRRDAQMGKGMERFGADDPHDEARQRELRQLDRLMRERPRGQLGSDV